MNKKILKIFTLTSMVFASFSLLSACNDTSSNVSINSGWEDLDGWEDDEDFSSSDDTNNNDLPYSYPETSFVNFNGSDRTWCGAEGCYYEGANYEFYREEKEIIADFQDGAIISFVINSSYDSNARLWVRLAVDTLWKTIWASDKFTLIVNGQDVNLNATEGVNEKWLWQQANWWEPNNFIDANFGVINLVSGNNTIELRTKNNDNFEDHCHILIDCFMIDPA